MYCDPHLYQQDPDEFYSYSLDDLQDIESPSFLTNLLKELTNVCKTINRWRIKLWQNHLN